jgi:hypothetical protein
MPDCLRRVTGVAVFQEPLKMESTLVMKFYRGSLQRDPGGLPVETPRSVESSLSIAARHPVNACTPKLHIAAFMTVVLVLLLVQGAGPVFGGGTGEDVRVTLVAKAEPLEEVLNRLSGMTGIRFRIRDEWRRIPVSGSLENVPLSRALKRLLVNYDHAVIYESDDVARIVIYGQTERGKASAASPAAAPYSRTPNEPPAPEETVEPPEEGQPEPEQPVRQEEPPPTGQPGQKPSEAEGAAQTDAGDRGEAGSEASPEKPAPGEQPPPPRP